MAMYDPHIIDNIRREYSRELIDQMEMYIQQEDFTHPGFFGLLRRLLPPFDLLRAITKLSELLEIPGCDPSYYKMVNRKIRQRLYPFMVAYHAGLARQADVLLPGRERDDAKKVVTTKSWKDKVVGRFKSDAGDNEQEGGED